MIAQQHHCSMNKRLASIGIYCCCMLLVDDVTSMNEMASRHMHQCQYTLFSLQFLGHELFYLCICCHAHYIVIDCMYMCSYLYTYNVLHNRYINIHDCTCLLTLIIFFLLYIPTASLTLQCMTTFMSFRPTQPMA